jgi:hypothetical protein
VAFDYGPIGSCYAYAKDSDATYVGSGTPSYADW